MRRHGERCSYNIPGEDEIADIMMRRPAAGCPVSGRAASATASAAPPSNVKFRFDRLFEKHDIGDAWDGLVALGRAMNADPPDAPDDSDIPAGYTYLGQFIAHEITFDQTKLLEGADELPEEFRSPSLDLDSLYGPSGPRDERMYDGDEFVLGENTVRDFKIIDRKNDLLRERKEADGKVRFEAVVGDPRNDENLVLAQTHLAFMKFHNRVVKYLRDNPDEQAAGVSVFEQAREKVVRHLQHIVLNDFLNEIADEGVVKLVLGGDTRCEKLTGVASKDELFMPVEFSAAAFRLGHSMVRPTYDYNTFHRSGPFSIMKPAKLEEFFTFTQFSGNLGGDPSLRSDWVIDWRRFYDFGAPGFHNRAKKIDTNFHLHIDRIPGFPQDEVRDEFKALAVRNLVRGGMMKLPTGQHVAGRLGEDVMTDELKERASDAVRGALVENKFLESTPLWFYILKEAELRGDGNRLGPVGSRIVAETLHCVIKHSDYSVVLNPLTADEMLPGRTAGEFDMVDLLSCLGGDVNPSRED